MAIKKQYYIYVLVFIVLGIFYSTDTGFNDNRRTLIHASDCSFQCNTTADNLRLCECNSIACLNEVCQCTGYVAVWENKVQCKPKKYDSVWCTAEEIAGIVADRPIANSNCPDNSPWMRMALQHTDPLKPVVLISVGCNKGDDLLNLMHTWSRNDIYDYSTMNQHGIILPGKTL
jgi:hypothetical protein